MRSGGALSRGLLLPLLSQFLECHVLGSSEAPYRGLYNLKPLEKAALEGSELPSASHLNQARWPLGRSGPSVGYPPSRPPASQVPLLSLPAVQPATGAWLSHQVGTDPLLALHPNVYYGAVVWPIPNCYLLATGFPGHPPQYANHEPQIYAPGWPPSQIYYPHSALLSPPQGAFVTSPTYLQPPTFPFHYQPVRVVEPTTRGYVASPAPHGTVPQRPPTSSTRVRITPPSTRAIATQPSTVDHKKTSRPVTSEEETTQQSGQKSDAQRVEPLNNFPLSSAHSKPTFQASLGVESPAENEPPVETRESLVAIPRTEKGERPKHPHEYPSDDINMLSTEPAKKHLAVSLPQDPETPRGVNPKTTEGSEHPVTRSVDSSTSEWLRLEAFPTDQKEESTHRWEMRQESQSAVEPASESQFEQAEGKLASPVPQQQTKRFTLSPDVLDSFTRRKFESVPTPDTKTKPAMRSNSPTYIRSFVETVSSTPTLPQDDSTSAESALRSTRQVSGRNSKPDSKGSRKQSAKHSARPNILPSSASQSSSATATTAAYTLGQSQTHSETFSSRSLTEGESPAAVPQGENEVALKSPTENRNSSPTNVRLGEHNDKNKIEQGRVSPLSVHQELDDSTEACNSKLTQSPKLLPTQHGENFGKKSMALFVGYEATSPSSEAKEFLAASPPHRTPSVSQALASEVEASERIEKGKPLVQEVVGSSKSKWSEKRKIKKKKKKKKGKQEKLKEIEVKTHNTHKATNWVEEEQGRNPTRDASNSQEASSFLEFDPRESEGKSSKKSVGPMNGHFGIYFFPGVNAFTTSLEAELVILQRESFYLKKKVNFDQPEIDAYNKDKNSWVKYLSGEGSELSSEVVSNAFGSKRIEVESEWEKIGQNLQLMTALAYAVNYGSVGVTRKTPPKWHAILWVLLYVKKANPELFNRSLSWFQSKGPSNLVLKSNINIFQLGMMVLEESLFKTTRNS